MRTLLRLFAAASLAIGSQSALAQDTIKVGLIAPLTGPFASTGQELQAAARLYVQHHGSTVAGKKIELIIRDDGGVADTTKRIAQELLVNDKVHFLTGMGLTPLALATAPLATQSKVPLVVMAAGTSTIPNASPFIIRTSYSAPHPVSVGARHFAKSAKNVVTLVSDFAPGIDVETWFKRIFEESGGKVVQSLRIPLLNPDFAPFLQRAADAKPDAVFVFVPAGQGSTFMRQFLERGLDKSGIKLFVEGGLVDDQILDGFGDAALGIESAYHYSDGHPSELNKRFTADFEKLTSGMRANFMGVGGYDGMAVIYKSLEKTGGDTDGTKLIEAMKGMSWESPRGPVSIDPVTRDIQQNVYMRRVTRINGRLTNVEFETYSNVKDPSK